jgi:SAM-dependent methyltransferase
MGLKPLSELEAFYEGVAPHYDADYALLFPRWTSFYLGLAQETGGPVLEAGCGTGRISIEIARAEIECHGVDVSAHMLDRFHQKLASEPESVRRRITITHADFRTAALDRRFALIIAPGNVMNSFIDRTDQRAWLRNVHRHLDRGGLFCFDTFQPDYVRMLNEFSQGIFDVDRIEEGTGHRIRRWTRCHHEFEFQRFLVEMRWTVQDAGGTIVSEQSKAIMQRWYTQAELLNLLELERFEVRNYWGDFDRMPFGPASPEQIVLSTPSEAE